MSMSNDHTRVLMDEVRRHLPAEAAMAGPIEEQQRHERLRTAWFALVDWLALGPAPRMRDCPRCGHSGIHDATRCGHCWVALAASP